MKPCYKKLASYLLLTVFYTSCLFATENTVQPTEIEELARLTESDLDDALDLTESMIAKDNSDAEVWYWKGRIHAQMASRNYFTALHHAGESESAFQEAVRLEPDNIKYLISLSSFYISAPAIAGGDVDKANDIHNKIYATSPYDGLMQRYRLARNEEEPEAIKKHLKQGIEEFADLPDFYYLLGLHYQQEEQYDKAMDYFTEAVSKPFEDAKSTQYHWNAVYQIGRNSVLAETYLKDSQDAFENYIKKVPVDNQLPSVEWATYRLAQLLALNNDSKALNIIADIKTKDKALLKALKKSKKSWKRQFKNKS